MPNARLNAHAVAEHLRTLTHLAMPVRDWEVEVGLDATDDLAVWVWLTVDDEDFDDTARRRQVQEQVFRGRARHLCRCGPLGLRALSDHLRDDGVSLHDDLREQARHLCSKEPRRPKQASLRRAVSSAYYALFHKLVFKATHRFIRLADRAELRQCLGRAFGHADMKDVSVQFAKGTVSPKL